MERVTQWTDFQIIYYKAPGIKCGDQNNVQTFSTEINLERNKKSNQIVNICIVYMRSRPWLRTSCQIDAHSMMKKATTATTAQEINSVLWRISCVCNFVFIMPLQTHGLIEPIKTVSRTECQHRTQKYSN